MNKNVTRFFCLKQKSEVSKSSIMYEFKLAVDFCGKTSYCHVFGDSGNIDAASNGLTDSTRWMSSI